MANMIKSHHTKHVGAGAEMEKAAKVLHISLSVLIEEFILLISLGLVKWFLRARK